MKYKLTKESKEEYGVKLFRIEATESFSNVDKGEKGGWIEKVENLDQEGNAWVYGDAQVYGNAWVCGNAWVYGKLLIGGYFYHTKQKSEKIEAMENDENYETLCSEPKYGEEKPVESLSGKKVKVELDGKSYTATID